MRGQGEGSIYRRADGYWVGSVEAGLYENGGRRKARVVRRKRVDVVRALDGLRRAVEGGVTPDRTSTLATFLDFWLDEVAANNVSASSLNEYRKRVRRVPPSIGKVKLHKLTAAHVQRLANHLTTTYPRSPKTVSTTMDTIRSGLRWAYTAGLIIRNPADGVRVKSAPSTKVDDTLTPDEARSVLTASTSHPLHALVWLAINYGLRLGELLDLAWSDVDFASGELTVRKSKTAAGVRTLPLTDEAAEVLRQHRRQNPRITGYVFATSTGGHRTPQRTRDAWNAILGAAGVAHLCRNCNTPDTCSTSVRRFHASRHTAATMLLSAGVPLEVVSAILGHSSIGITADIYAKVRADLKRAGLAKVAGQGEMPGT